MISWLEVTERGAFETPKVFVLIVHGHIQNAGIGWNGYHTLLYHTYVSAEKNVLKNVLGIENETFCLDRRLRFL